MNTLPRLSLAFATIVFAALVFVSPVSADGPTKQGSQATPNIASPPPDAPKPTPIEPCKPRPGIPTPEQESRIAQLHWADDNPWEVEALRELAAGAPDAFEAWMDRFGNVAPSYDLINLYSSIAYCDESVAIRIVVMPFLDDVATNGGYDPDARTALWSLSRLARKDLAALESVLAHPALDIGISDNTVYLLVLLALEHDGGNGAAFAKSIRELPWVLDGIVHADERGYNNSPHGDDEPAHVIDLVRIAMDAPKSFSVLVEEPWIKDGVEWFEEALLIDMKNMAVGYRHDAAAASLLAMPFLSDFVPSQNDAKIMRFLSHLAFYRELEQLLESPMLVGGIKNGQLANLALIDLEFDKPDAAARLRKQAWFESKESYPEHLEEAILAMTRAANSSDRLFDTLISKAWVKDGLSYYEADVVTRLAQMATWEDTEEIVLQVLAMSFLQEVSSFDVGVVSYLPSFILRGGYEQLISHPDIDGDITDANAAFIPLPGYVPWHEEELLNTLLDPQQTSLESKVISLPLAGEVRLSVMDAAASTETTATQSTAMALLEHSVRTQEEFMGLPFQEQHVALLIPRKNITGSGGSYNGNGIMHSVVDHFRIIAHETGHTWRFAPPTRTRGPGLWIHEGVADFLEAISSQALTGVPLPTPSSSCGQAGSIEEHIKLYQHEVYCSYRLGHGMYQELYDALGDKPFKQGLRNMFEGNFWNEEVAVRQTECEYAVMSYCFFKTTFLSDLSTQHRAIAEEIITRRFYGAD